MMADPIPSATARTPIRPTYGESGRSSESEFAGVGDRREYDGKSATDIRVPPTIPTVGVRPFRCAKGFARHGFCCRRRKLPTPGSRVSLFTRSNADISVQNRNDICWHSAGDKWRNDYKANLLGKIQDHAEPANWCCVTRVVHCCPANVRRRSPRRETRVQQ
jgi:hypothetical protein